MPKRRMMQAPDPEPLFKAAETVRSNAYAPYSVYRVSAAVLDEQGRIHVGVNVENVSFGLTVCAERNAVAAMAAAGGREIKAVVVVTDDGGTPCGACRQVLTEFAPNPSEVWVFGRSPLASWQATLSDLLPGGFKSELKKEP